MGGIFSSKSSDETHNLCYEGSPSGMCQRQSVTRCFEQSSRLIPFLPNDISLIILARVPRAYYWQLKLVSRSWMEALSTTEIYKLRREFKTTEELLFIFSRVEENLICYALDPVSQIWQKLPPLPHNSTQNESQRGLGSKIKNADPPDNIPLCGCSIGAVNGCLYLVGGLSRTMTLRCVWRYDPTLNVWSEVSPMLTGRAYSKTGVLNNKLYVVGGVTAYLDIMTALQSAEVFDPETDEWSEIPSMPFSEAQVTPIAHRLKPIATGLTPYKGKLYVPQSLNYWPLFIDAGGEIYDLETNSWVEMPVGMCDGWPNEQAGNRSSVVVDDEFYALDLSRKDCFDSAKIKVYDKRDDSWKVFCGEVPMPHSSTKAESPYLIACFKGKFHVIIKDENFDIIVFEACSPLPPSDGAFSSSQVSWKGIASKRAGPAELIGCQILSI